jgi:4-amino-4-deoxy-L-arabinose transferase-like glycosyltransferase
MNQRVWEFVPVYRPLLSGGPAQLRLSLRQAAIIAVYGTGLGFAALAVTGLDEPHDWTCLLARVWTTTLAALVLAMLTAKWFGRRTALLAAIAYLTSIHSLLGDWMTDEAVFLTPAMCLAMSAFATATVPGRLPRRPKRRTAWIFYAATAVMFMIAGIEGLTYILCACVLYAVVSQDLRSIRFFWDPIGIALFVLLVAAHAMAVRLEGLESWQDFARRLLELTPDGLDRRQSPSEILHWLAVATLPWTPMMLIPLVGVLRQGHYATPIVQLFAAWLVAPLAISAAGVFACEPHTSAVLPPLAVFAAAGLEQSRAWRHRWRRSFLPSVG